MVKKCLARLLILVLIATPLLSFLPTPVYADENDFCNLDITPPSSGSVYSLNSDVIKVSSNKVTYNGEPARAPRDGDYYIKAEAWRGAAPDGDLFRSTVDVPMVHLNASANAGELLPLDVTRAINEVYGQVSPDGSKDVSVYVALMKKEGLADAGVHTTVCSRTITASKPQIYSCHLSPQSVNLSLKGSETVNVNVTVSGKDLPRSRPYVAWFRESGKPGTTYGIPLQADGGNYTNGASFNIPDGQYTLLVVDHNLSMSSITDLRAVQPGDIKDCLSGFTVTKSQLKEDLTPEDNFTPPNEGNGEVVTYDAAFGLCKQIKDPFSPERKACEACAGYTTEGGVTKDGKAEATKGLWTAVGCIPTSYQGITGAVLKIGLSIAGGVALLLILAGAFMLSTSQGEPKRAGEARELLTSAVVGLIFIIFSVTLLQFIGVDILQLPGFGAGEGLSKTAVPAQKQGSQGR